MPNLSNSPLFVRCATKPDFFKHSFASLFFVIMDLKRLKYDGCWKLHSIITLLHNITLYLFVLEEKLYFNTNGKMLCDIQVAQFCMIILIPHMLHLTSLYAETISYYFCEFKEVKYILGAQSNENSSYSIKFKLLIENTQ